MAHSKIRFATHNPVLMKAKHIILSILFVGLTIQTFSQQFEYQGTIIGKTSDGLRYNHADLDDDGDNDILVGGDGRLTWLENDGAGNYPQEHTIWKVIDFNPQQIEVADVTGDLKPDVLVRFSDGAGRLYLFTNDGQGGFLPPVEIVGNSYLREFTLSNLDGDSDIDLLLVMENPLNDLHIYENDGAGNFSNQLVIQDVGTGLNTAVCGNLGGSALPDILASAIVDDEVVWYENLGGLTFSSQNLVTTDHDYPRQLDIADLNGDLDNDIIVSSYSDEDLAWFENSGSGSFGTQNLILNSPEWPQFVAADVDGDNDIDLLTNTGTDESLVLHTNNGSGSFSAPISLSSGDPYFYFDAFDSNNDTYVDVVFSPFSVPSRGSLRFVENNNNLGFNNEEVLAYGLTDCEAFHYADIDGDGWQDVISISSRDNTVFLSRNLGNGIFDVPTIISDTVQFAHSVLAVDLDNDTDMDVLALARGYSGGSNNNRVHVFENDGSGNLSFSTHLALGAGNQAPRFSFVNTVDIDGNEYQDVMVTSYDNSIERIYQFLNNGNLSFSNHTSPIQFYTDVQFTEFADFNGDTAPDFVYLREQAGEIMYMENDGNGGFPSVVEISLPTVVSSFTKGMSLEVADMDGDEDYDILVSLRQNFSTTSQSSMKLLYLVNDGSANFNSHVIVQDTYGIAWDTEVGDIDGDMDMDVAVVGIYGTSWLRNEGGGNFVLEVIDSVTTGSIIQGAVLSHRILQLVDLDNDHDLDIVNTSSVGSYDKRFVRWSKNEAIDCAVLPTVASNATTAVCEEVPITLTATGGTIFSWNNGLDDQASHVVLPEQTTTYVVTVSDGADCIYTDSVTVEVIPGPVATVNLNWPYLETETFDNYQWLLDDAVLGGETNQSVIPSAPGGYSVLVTDNVTGCSDTSSVYTIITVDVNNQESHHVEVFPNPTNGAITISSGTESKLTMAVLRNALGQEVSSYPVNGMGRTELNFNLPSGVYLLELYSKTELTSSRRLVVNRK